MVLSRVRVVVDRVVVRRKSREPSRQTLPSPRPKKASLRCNFPLLSFSLLPRLISTHTSTSSPSSSPLTLPAFILLHIATVTLLIQASPTPSLQLQIPIESLYQTSHLNNAGLHCRRGALRRPRGLTGLERHPKPPRLRCKYLIVALCAIDSSVLTGRQKSCITNMLNLAPSLGCGTGNITCLCTNMDFGNGIRDCSSESCPSGTDTARIISVGNAFCQSE